MVDSKRTKSSKLWVIAAAFVFWVSWISGIFGNVGIYQAYRLSQVRRDLTQRVQALEKERVKLVLTLGGIERDPYAQELAIRETLGFARENELVFEFR